MDNDSCSFCRPAGRQAGISTHPRDAAPLEVAEALLGRARVRDAFAAVFTPAGKVRPKPYPDLILAAAAGLGTPAKELLVIGDSEYDRRAAEAAGTRFHLFRGFKGVGALLWGSGSEIQPGFAQD